MYVVYYRWGIHISAIINHMSPVLDDVIFSTGGGEVYQYWSAIKLCVTVKEHTISISKALDYKRQFMPQNGIAESSSSKDQSTADVTIEFEQKPSLLLYTLREHLITH
jgi:hypothetical protein